MKREIKKKKGKPSNPINLKNPIHWWGLIVLVLGVTLGGALGGGLGALCGVYIFKIGNNPKFSTAKKIGISFLITLGGIVGYITLGSIIFSFLPRS